MVREVSESLDFRERIVFPNLIPERAIHLLTAR
jgi:hypothetical protein